MTVKATIHYERPGHPIEIKAGQQPAIWISPADAWQLCNQLHSAIMSVANDTPSPEAGETNERDDNRGTNRNRYLRLLRRRFDVRIRH